MTTVGAKCGSENVGCRLDRKKILSPIYQIGGSDENSFAGTDHFFNFYKSQAVFQIYFFHLFSVLKICCKDKVFKSF